jgi:hypothetical protein
MITQEKIITAFDGLGKVFLAISNQLEWSGYELGVTSDEYEKLQALVKRQFHLNGWFTEEAVLHVFRGWGEQLTTQNLIQFTSGYSFAAQPKKVGVIMAGNIPLVGFHDFLCVLLSGNSIVIKLSSDDKTLLPALISILKNFLPELANRITVSEAKLGEVDAIIATGSGNSMRYFESYFGHLPHLFRKNRTSVAVLTGNETKEELEALGADIFTHFGLGCRNVSHLIVHKDFEINRFFEAIIKQADVVNLHKYANNYDYNKAIYLMNLEQILDNGFVLLKESEELFSPLAMLFYHRYEEVSEVESYLEKHKEDIQAVVGHGYLSFGSAQCPTLTDFADGVDTMSWLSFN